MNKQDALNKWQKAVKLRFHDSLEKWKNAFPTTESFAQFYEDTKNLSWPENYGQSPMDDAFDIAYYLRNGISETSKKFYAENLDSFWIKQKGEKMDYYGIKWRII